VEESSDSMLMYQRSASVSNRIFGSLVKMVAPRPKKPLRPKEVTITPVLSKIRASTLSTSTT